MKKIQQHVEDLQQAFIKLHSDNKELRSCLLQELFQKK